MILTPAPYGSNKKSAHIAIILHASGNLKLLGRGAIKCLLLIIQALTLYDSPH